MLDLNLIDTDKTVVCDKLKHSDNGFKYFIGYLDDDDDDDIIRLLYSIFPQMSGYIKYFDDDGKICLLKLKMKVYT